ncbi:MAG TPA: carboxypeptidase regulatory-like domain-containing protein [Polyangiaceae bacterium]|nr:carboxypeptidase regulatory-like domain-containing protein [Polyangiaceae bacterium]
MRNQHLSTTRLAWFGFAFAAACSGGGDNVFQNGQTTGTNAGSGTGTLGLTTGSGGSSTRDDDGGVAPPHPCENLECYQNSCALGSCKIDKCAAGATTSVSGTVFDPAGKVPLYNVIVYVPNAPVDAITTGATCDRCGAISGSPIASALTDAKGHFKLDNVPVTTDIPLVIQVGKWRRQIKLPAVTACADTPLTDKNMTRLPKSQAEGDIPKMALTTGGADALECLLRKIGIADSEFTPESGKGRVNFYNGTNGTNRYAQSMNGGARFTTAPMFWSSADSLKKYDLVLLSCEGIENPTNKGAAAVQAMQAYANAGGRVFASHWHNYWLEHGPAPFPTVATFNHQKDLANPFTADIDTSFPKGAALADWLVNVGSAAPRGKLVIKAAQHTVDATNAAVAQRWIYSTDPNSVQYMTTNTPMNVPEESQCGRVVLSDIHVSSGDLSDTVIHYPDGCTTSDLSDQEKALEFMLFDLSSCIRRDDRPPEPPGTVN